MTNSAHPFLSINWQKFKDEYNFNYFVVTLIFTLLSFNTFCQNFDESFIQYSRNIENILVLETEGQLSWIDESSNDTIHWKKENRTIDEMPRLQGCENIVGGPAEKKKCGEQKMLEYIYSNLVYPVEALEDRIEGRVIVSFHVNPDGKMSNAIAKNDMGAYTAGAALDVINKMNTNRSWIPGKSNGLATPTLYTIPILFRLGPENRLQHPKMYSKYYGTNNDWELVYDTEGEPTLNEEAEVRMLISKNGKVLNTRIYNPLSATAQERANEIVLDLLDNSTWRPGSTHRFEDTMEYVFTLKM